MRTSRGLSAGTGLLRFVLALLVGGAMSLTAQTPGDDRFETVKKWDFRQKGDTLGWVVPRSMMGAVVGGSLWIKCHSEPLDGEGYYDHGKSIDAFWNWKPRVIASPAEVGVDAGRAKKLRMRILNLSSETNGTVSWTTTDTPDKEIGPVGFAMQPYSKEWQDIVVHLDEVPWSGEIRQIKLVMGLQGVRGDIYIDWIALTGGEPRSKPAKPDIVSEAILPRISLPGISQKDFASAFGVLDKAMVYDNLPNGITRPFIAPGGYWGDNWWLGDSSMTVPALKWVNLSFCEEMIRGFIGLQRQNPDGRIDHEGKAVNRGAPGDTSVLPDFYFAAAYDVFKATGDASLREEIYKSLSSYMDWWLSPLKRNGTTGLFTGHFEETFGFADKDNVGKPPPQTVAQVDLNVALCLGSYILADICRRAGRPEESASYRALAEEIAGAVNRYLWNEDKSAYLNYNVVERKHQPYFWSHAFWPLRKGIAPPERQQVLLKSLLDPALFNWGKVPLTSMAKTDPSYKVVLGHYDPKAWNGSIWTLKNLFIIKGLIDIGRHELASELNWATIKAFNANYYEFLEPETGAGQGTEGFSSTAAQYIEAIIENLFGIDYDRQALQLTLFPHVPAELEGRELRIDNLTVPGSEGNKLGLKLKASGSDVEIDLTVTGPLDQQTLLLLMPAESSSALGLVVTDRRDGRAIPLTSRPEAGNTVGAVLKLEKQMSLAIGPKGPPEAREASLSEDEERYVPVRMFVLQQHFASSGQFFTNAVNINYGNL